MAQFSFEEAQVPSEDQPTQAPPNDQPKSFTFEEAQIPAGAKPVQHVKKPEPEMPTVGSALLHGVGSGIRHSAQGIQTIRGIKPEGEETPESPAAAPFEWRDVTSPISRGLPKLAYGLGESAPELVGGLAGGAAGAMTPIPGGTLMGGALGAGGMAALKTIAPHLKEELAKNPQDPDAAWTKAVERAGISGATAGASWGMFGLGAKALDPLKRIAFQALGIQPGVSMAGQAAQNVVQGKEATEGLPQAYVQGAVGTAIPMAGHAVLGSAFREAQNVAARRAADPILSRLGHPDDLRTAGQIAGLKQKLSDLYTAVKDDLNPVKQIEKHIMDGTPIPPELSAYVAMRLTRGSAGRAEHFIEHGTFDALTGKDNGPGLAQVLNPVKNDMEPWRKYLLSRRAIEKSNEGVDVGVPIEEAKAFVKENPQFAKPFDSWRLFNKNTLKYMVDSGLVSPEAGARMEAKVKDYVPLYRLMESPEVGPSGGTNPGPGMRTYNPYRSMGESQLKILDPIETTIRNTYLFLSLADRNMALQKLEDLNFLAPAGKKFLEKVPRPVRPIQVSAEEVERALRRQSVKTSAEPEGFSIFRPDAFRPDADHVRIYREGKPTIYKVDQRLGEAVNGLNREQLNMLTRILAVPAKTLRAGATLSPEFIARNPMRDQFSAFIFSTFGRGYIPLVDLVQGLGSVMKRGEGYRGWLKDGGANSAMVSIDRDYIANLVRKMNDPTLGGTLKNVAKSPLEVLRALSETMENATRVGEYMRLKKAGASREAAGIGSREVTLDFQRIGAKMQGLNAIIAFFNAQAEGVDRMFRSMKEQPLGFAAKVGASITLPSVALWAANVNDPRWKEIPRWQKDIFWIIMNDNWQPVSTQDANKVSDGFKRQNKETGQWEVNKGNIWRIPKPFEIGVLFGSVPERILDAYHMKNPNFVKDMLAHINGGDIPGFAKRLADIDKKGFKGVGSSLQSAFLPNFVPQLASPLIEQFANRSLFTERPLIPKYLENLVPQEQYNPYTTDIAKITGRAMANIPGVSHYFGLDKPGSLASPIMVENYVRAWTGGLGQHALHLIDAGLRGAGITPTPILPTLTPADKTIQKAFAVRFPEAGANSVQDFYEEFNRRKSIKDTASFLSKSGRQDQANEYIRENVLATADGIQKALGAQLKAVRGVYLNPKNTMTPDEKRHYIDMAYFQMIKMAQTGNKLFKDSEEAFRKRKENQ